MKEIMFWVFVSGFLGAIFTLMSDKEQKTNKKVIIASFLGIISLFAIIGYVTKPENDANFFNIPIKIFKSQSNSNQNISQADNLIYSEDN